MRRVSTNMSNDDLQYFMRLREWQLNDVQNQIASQTRIQNLRDDPVAAADSTRYQSEIVRMKQFSQNVGQLQSDYKIVEGYMQSANSILQRVRELAVQGANGTYNASQKKMMGSELNELLNELVTIANARGADGTTIFSGDRTQSLAYRTLKGNVPGADGQVITSVRYTGALAKNVAEISDNSFMPTGVAGDKVFWAEQNSIMSDVNATTYTVQQDSTINIDGNNIQLRAGDNVYAIIAKINDSDAAVKASLDPVKDSLVITTTYPHQLWLQDGKGSTVLADLGVVNPLGRPPYNAPPDARVSGGSLFDMIMYLRDKLFDGETLDVGGAALKGIDLAQNVLLSSLAEVGSRSERLNTVSSRLAYETPELVQRNSNAVDLDMTGAIMNLKMLEYTHQAALQTAAQILQPTLLDFLR